MESNLLERSASEWPSPHRSFFSPKDHKAWLSSSLPASTWIPEADRGRAFADAARDVDGATDADEAFSVPFLLSLAGKIYE